MGASLNVSSKALISGVILLAAEPALAQQAGPLPDAIRPPAVAKELAPQPLVNGGGGGYGAAPLFSPFPRDGALQPLSFRVPGLKPADEAPREFDVTFGVEGDEKWSDNVYSTPQPTKADFITSAGASLGANVDTRRVKGGLNYGLTYDKYATYSDLDGFRQNGIGLFDAEVIDQRFFISGRASVSQQSISATGPTTADSRTAAGNTVRVYTESVSPRVQQRFGEWALGQISYHHDETRYENASQGTPQTNSVTTSQSMTAANLNDSRTDGGRVEVRGGEAFSRLLWDYTGDVNRDVSSARTFDQVTHTVGTEYRLSADFGLLAAVGNDYLHSTAIDLSTYGGAFYSGGVHWTPSPDTDLRVGLGRRYDRPDWIMLLAHWLGPTTVVRVSVSSGVTTDSLSFERALNAVQRDVDGGFVDPFSGLTANPSASPFSRSNSIYWQRNSDLVLRHDELRDSVALSARVAEQQVIGTANNLNSQFGTNTTPGSSATVLAAYLTWMHHFTPDVSGLAVISQSDTIVSGGAIGRVTQRKGSLSLNYTLNPTLMGTLGYNIISTAPTPSGNISENMIAAGLRKTF